MDDWVCARVSVYQDALTRGNRYHVLAHDNAKRQVRVKGDNGRTRWFPVDCFDQSSSAVPTLSGYLIDDPITPGQELSIDVTIHR
jgi:hypothetical protein